MIVGDVIRIGKRSKVVRTSDTETEVMLTFPTRIIFRPINTSPSIMSSSVCGHRACRARRNPNVATVLQSVNIWQSVFAS